MTPRRNVLIFHSGALGDFILTWPLAVALGRVFPQSRIFYVVSGEKGALAERVLRVESLDAESGWHHLYSDSPRLPPTATTLLSRAHCVFTFIAGHDSAWVRNVRSIAPAADVVSLSQAPPGDFTGHQSDFLLEQLRPTPVWHEALRQILKSVEARGITSPRSGSHALLHPGSGSPHKCWPLSKFADLARQLQAAGRSPRIILGEVELDRWSPAEIASLDAVAPTVRPKSLVELWQAYGEAACFVGNDSGPGHLAGIAGIPSVTLFGPTSPDLWRPLGPRAQVIQRSPIESIEVADVMGRLPPA